MFNSKRIKELEERVAVLERVMTQNLMDKITDSLGHLALTVVKDKKKTVSNKKKRTYIKSGKYSKKNK